MHVKSTSTIVCTFLLLLAGCHSNTVSSSFSNSALTKPSKISLDENGVTVIDGQKIFPITLTIIPKPDDVTPDGKNAYQEFHDAGCTFMRTGGMSGQRRTNVRPTTSTGKQAEIEETPGPTWNAAGIAAEWQYQNAAAAHGMRCCPWLGWSLANFDAGNEKMDQELKTVLNTFKDSPGMGFWKGADEPEWGNEHNPKQSTPSMCEHVANIIHETDPNHPIWLVQAPRGTMASMKRYSNCFDVGGIDIYPISYPPGVHVPFHPNKEISMVGDWTQFIKEAANGKPYWMTLQIAFSGVTPTAKAPDKPIRFPSFAEERYMSYQAIINGARGLVYFGGGNATTLNDRDRALGWNWTFWNSVLRPLLKELGTDSVIEPALVAPDSKLPVKCILEKVPVKKLPPGDSDPAIMMVPPTPGQTAPGVEFVVRETNDAVYILAAKREGDTIQVRFTGLPTSITAKGSVMFEEPRKIPVKDGAFTDWFAPFDVHVYKFAK
jgi:hypothetical protein